MKERKNLYASIVGWGMFLAGAFAFSSCADEELDNVSQSTGKSIGFSTSYSKSVWEPDETRAVQKKNNYRCESTDGEFSIDVSVEDGIRSSITEQVQSRGTQITAKGDWKYNVGAYYTTDPDATEQAARTVDFFSENTNGGLSFASNATNATTNYYWPPVGTMKFFAVAPTDVVNAEGSTFAIPTVENINTPTLTYTIPSEVAAQKDIMVAQSTVTCNGNNGPVDLKFEHLLAAVQFKVGKMQFIKINSLSIEGVQGGTVTMTFDNETGSWSYTNVNENDETSTSYNIISTPENGEPNIDTSVLSEGAYITDNENGLMLLVMPQSLGRDQKIKINYTEIITSENEEFEFTFETIPHNWEAGKTTTYIVNIDTDITNIEIPSPPDADAHYVRVDINYDLTGFAQYANKGITISNIVASTRWLDDGSNTASDDKQDIFMKTTLTDKQKEGFFTDELWELEYSVDENNNKTYTKGSANGPELTNENILGEKTINSLTTNDKGTIYLFLDENNGTTDRNGELILTAKVTKDNNSRTLILGNGKFKQLCPSWNNDATNNIGVERFENENSKEGYPFGFSYNRVITYKNPRALWFEDIFTNGEWWEQIGAAIYYLILRFTGSIAESVLPDSEGIAEDFIDVSYYNGYITTVVLDYGKLNTVEAIASSTSGIDNTSALYNYTGQTDIAEFEKLVDESFGTPSAGGAGENWTKEITKPGEKPDDYAAFIALTRNRMREVKTVIKSSKETSTNTQVMLHREGEGGTDGKGNESGAAIIEWYLPSYEESVTLKETGTGDEAISISPLNGTYWSSRAGVDPSSGTNGYAYSYTYSNNVYSTYKSNEDRTNKLKVRAVRKKPTTTTNN